MNKELNQEITDIVKKWIVQQKEVAKKMGVSASALNQMLNNVVLLPFPRFLQLIYYTQPSQEEIDKVFELYLIEFKLPVNSITLSRQKNRIQNSRSKIHSMIDRMTEDQLQKIEPLLHLILEK